MTAKKKIKNDHKTAHNFPRLTKLNVFLCIRNLFFCFFVIYTDLAKTSPSSQSAIQWFAALLPEEGGSGGRLGYSCSYCSYENTTATATATHTKKNTEAFSSGFREPGSDSTEQHFTAEHFFLFL